MKIIKVAILNFLVFGCATQTYNINGGARVEPTQETMQPFFISGIGQTKIVDAATLCGGADKVAKVESHESFVNILLGFITWGIFTPRQASVYCTG